MWWFVYLRVSERLCQVKSSYVQPVNVKPKSAKDSKRCFPSYRDGRTRFDYSRITEVTDGVW